jgi:hypothetical protein
MLRLSLLEMGRLPLLLCAVAVLADASRAPAQERPVSTPLTDAACPSRPATARGDTTARDTARAPGSTQSSGDNPTIVLRASVSAREVRFASQPRIEVRLCGGILDSVKVLERRNLPDPVQPGVTYRDVFIAVEILGHLNAECISNRITGRPVSGRDPCAGLQVRDTSGANRRTPP